MKIYKPFFWENKNFFSIFFYPLTSITYLLNFFKKFNKRKIFSIKTICVGNIYIGGTGKTPLVIEINKILKKKFFVL